MARRRDHHARLGTLVGVRLALGAWLGNPSREAVERALYSRHRDELLERFPPTADGSPAAFWAFDALVPDTLRRGDASTDTDGRQLRTARAAWLRRMTRVQPPRVGSRRPRRPRPLPSPIEAREDHRHAR